MLAIKTKHSLQKNFFLWFLGLSVIPMLLLLSIGLPQASKALKQGSTRLLAQTAETKAAFIDSWFTYRFKDLDYQAQNQRNSEFLQTLSKGLANSKLSPKDYVKSYDWVRKKTPNEETLLNLTRKYSYIYDIFLIDLSGNILFNVAHESELGSNLFIDNYSHSLFAQSVRQTLDSGRSLFSGIERYAPSNNMLTGFLTAPLLDNNGNKVGALAIQIKLDQLYQQVAGRKSSQSSQSSQHHYLIDRSGLLLSPISNTEQVLLTKINPDLLQTWSQNPVNVQTYTGPLGSTVFGHHTSINIANINWLLISEIDQTEALTSVYGIQQLAFSFLVILSLLSSLIALLQAKRIIKPITQLSAATRAISQGKSRQRVSIGRQDEIGELASSFNHMIEVREEYIKTIHDNNNKIQQALNELSEQKFALDQHAIVATTDLAGTITYVNDRFCAISGYSHDELLGKNHRILNSAHHPQEFFEQMYETITSGSAWHNEICNQAKDGSLYWVDTTVVPIKNAAGEPISYIAIRTDISHIKKVESQLTQAAASAEAASIAKSEFLANMSHEIRTPLNGVIGMNSLLLNGELNREQYNRCKIVASSANSLLTIINDILDFSKIEAGKLELEVIDFELATLIGEIGSSMAFKAEEMKIELICPASPLPSCWYLGDPGRIRQVLVNLIGNAIKFTPDGEVSVHVRVLDQANNGHHLLVEVIDSGIGLSLEQQQGLFERFTQADGSTTRKYGGTGLGLTISKQLVELMGGEINVESTVNEGSNFSIALPLEASKQVAPPKPASSLVNESILIVDDNYTNRKLLQELFDHWGIANQQVDSGANALQKLSDAAIAGEAFSTAIIDMQMPEMDGAELAQLIQQQDNIPDTKLVLLTSQAHRGDAKKMQQIGLNAFLTKPVNQSDLYNALLQVSSLDDDPRLITRHTAHERQTFNAKILIVEDNVTNQLVAKGMLEELGIEVDIAVDGQEAIKALSQQHYNLVFMDCQMPVMDGFEATRVIRDLNSKVQQHNINVIAMTANVMADDKKRCLDAGMDDFIAKPVNPSALQAMLSKWLENPKKDNRNMENSADYLPEEELAFAKSQQLQREEPKEQVFDHDVLQQLLSDKQQISSIIDAFISEMPSHLAELNSALQTGDIASVAALTHKIKGSAASIGANMLARIARHLESAAKEGNIQPLEQGLQDLTEGFKLFQEEL